MEKKVRKIEKNSKVALIRFCNYEQVDLSLTFYSAYCPSGRVNLACRGGFRGATRPAPPPPSILTCQTFFRALYLPLCQYLPKNQLCIALKCLLYVWATVKIQFSNTILNHTHPPLGHYASSHVRAPYSKILAPPLAWA